MLPGSVLDTLPRQRAWLAVSRGTARAHTNRVWALIVRNDEHGSQIRAAAFGARACARLCAGNAFCCEHGSTCAAKKVSARQFGGTLREVVRRVSH